MDSLRIKIEKKLRTFLCILVPFLLLIFIGYWTYSKTLHWPWNLSDSPRECRGEFDVCPAKIGSIETWELMPRTSKEIKYIFRNSGFGCYAEWKCRVDFTDFVDFAVFKNWNLIFNEKLIFTPEMPDYTSPSGQFIYATSNSLVVNLAQKEKIEIKNAHRGVIAIYDIEKKVMYGRYCSR